MLAADIFKPVELTTDPRGAAPVVWIQERYHRAQRSDSGVVSKLELHPELAGLLSAGYVVVIVDGRGSGASFGSLRSGPFSDAERWDAYDVTEWLATRAWSNGKVGMAGSSYSGTAQLMAASTCPPHLRAIAPEMALFDLYGFAHEGGIFREGFAKGWGAEVEGLDRSLAVAPVEGSDGEAQLRQAVSSRDNRAVLELLKPLRFRDSTDAVTGQRVYAMQSPSAHVAEISACPVAIFFVSGWRDLWPRDALIAYGALRNRRRLLMGAWSHTERDGVDLAAELRRWFDYWLKDIENGVMREPSLRYRTMGRRGAGAWRSSRRWPLERARAVRYYLAAGRTGTAGSVNDGALAAKAAGARSFDEFAGDAAATSGKASRWSNGYGTPIDYRSMKQLEQHGLTYTSPPLPDALEVTGHPIVKLWVDGAAATQPLFAFLSEIGRRGEVKYVSEGQLRVSHASLAVPVYARAGLPYHSGLQADVGAPQRSPVELTIDLQPTSNMFDAGHRLRLTLTTADRDNAELEPTPTAFGVQRGLPYASYLEVPTVAPEVEPSWLELLVGQLGPGAIMRTAAQVRP